MPFKKILKIAGLIVLSFVILFIALIIIVASFAKTSVLPVRNSLQSVTTGSAGINLSLPASKSSPMALEESAVDYDTAGMSGSVAVPAVPADKKIIKTGNLTLTVEKAETAAENISNLAKVSGGEVLSSNFFESVKGIKSGYVTVKVPNQKFETVFAEIKKVATEVVNESTNSQDITADYIDLEARLKNKIAEEQSFVALLNRSGKIEEVLSVTREVARVRGEIEQLEGQKRYLSSQTDMSTITANLSEDVEISPINEDWRPGQVIKNSVKQLITNGQSFIDGIIRFLVVVLPMLIIYALIVWLLYYLGKKVYNHFRKSV